MFAAVFHCPLLLSLIDSTKVQRSVSNGKDTISGLLIFYLDKNGVKNIPKTPF